jgi:PIN like domain
VKKQFPEYFPPTEAQIKKRWRSATIVLDANFLLRLYLFLPTDRENVLKVLKSLRSRLWVPNQAAFEFFRNRLQAIEQLCNRHDAILADLKKALQGVKDGRNKGQDLSPTVINSLESALTAVEREIAKSRKKAEALMTKDRILGSLQVILNGKVGAGFEDKDLNEIYKEGATRYAKGQPPGFEDKAKPEPDRFGDLVIWKEILRAGRGKHVFFVTWDEKIDWWYIFKGQKRGARPELIREALKAGLTSFHIFTGDRFLEHARRYGDTSISASEITEVRNANAAITAGMLVVGGYASGAAGFGGTAVGTVIPGGVSSPFAIGPTGPTGPQFVPSGTIVSAPGSFVYTPQIPVGNAYTVGPSGSMVTQDPTANAFVIGPSGAFVSSPSAFITGPSGSMISSSPISGAYIGTPGIIGTTTPLFQPTGGITSQITTERQPVDTTSVVFHGSNARSQRAGVSSPAEVVPHSHADQPRP